MKNTIYHTENRETLCICLDAILVVCNNQIYLKIMISIEDIATFCCISSQIGVHQGLIKGSNCFREDHIVIWEWVNDWSLLFQQSFLSNCPFFPLCYHWNHDKTFYFIWLIHPLESVHWGLTALFAGTNVLVLVGINAYVGNFFYILTFSKESTTKWAQVVNHNQPNFNWSSCWQTFGIASCNRTSIVLYECNLRDFPDDLRRLTQNQIFWIFYFISHSQVHKAYYQRYNEYLYCCWHSNSMKLCSEIQNEWKESPAVLTNWWMCHLLKL